VRNRGRLALLGVVALAGLAVLAVRMFVTMDEGIDRLLAETATEPRYVPPSSEAVAVAEGLFVRLMHGEWDDAIERGFADLGFDVGRLWVGLERLTVVREAPGRGEGRGVYLLRDGAARPAVALQAPHRPSDLDTDVLVARLMAEHPFAAAGWNTVHRRAADLAHLERTYFNAFTRAFARVHRRGRVVQFHGFDPDSRESGQGAGAEIVVSAGTRRPTRLHRDVRECLGETLASRVRLFPDEVGELGATTNANAAALRAMGFRRFIHLEMIRAVRRDLIADRQHRRYLAACLLEGKA